MFYFDLDELNSLHQKYFLFSRNRFNWFSFFDRDHVVTKAGRSSVSVKTKLVEYLKANGIADSIGKVMLLTNAKIFGYGFNPISVYICYDLGHRPLCAVAEVCNTHGEMKLYLLPKTTLQQDTFDFKTPKLFYVSPFVKMDASFRFIFKVPHASLDVRVDDYDGDRRFLLSTLTGRSVRLSDAQLLKFSVQFPLITIRIIALIYWQAFVLRLKQIPFKRKNDDLHLQENMFHYK